MNLGATAEDYLQIALDAAANGAGYANALDELPVPIYVTDAEGLVTYWNRACMDFAGRTPRLGSDRWCVSWQLFTTSGDRLPHDQCPMAEAIREQKPIRDNIAIARRPDGSLTAFRPYPTPLFDDDGSLKGAVNLLLDITDEQSVALRDQASRCRRLAQTSTDREITQMLEGMARGFDQTAAALRGEVATLQL